MPAGQTYKPAFTGPFQAVLPSNVSPMPEISGLGSPEGAIIAPPGQKYVDIETRKIYVKVAGTQKVGWQENGIMMSLLSGTVDVAADGSIWGKGDSGWTKLAEG